MDKAQQTLLNIFKLKGVAVEAHDDCIYIHDQYEDPVDAVGKMLSSYGFEKRSKYDYAKGMTSVTLLLPTGGDIVLRELNKCTDYRLRFVRSEGINNVYQYKSWDGATVNLNASSKNTNVIVLASELRGRAPQAFRNLKSQFPDTIKLKQMGEDYYIGLNVVPSICIDFDIEASRIKLWTYNYR
jgi:hypothetical protein